MTDENILDHNFLIANEDQDILDEFLDQRVYDLLGTTTPVNGAGVKAENSLDLFLHKEEFNEPNDYLYVNPNQYNKEPSSTYASPYDQRSSSHSSPAEKAAFSNVTSTQLSPRSATTQLSDYDCIRDEVSKLKFGNHEMNPCPPSVDVPDPSYLDFSNETMASLPYKLDVSDLPNCSRVETQIKLKLHLSPPPPHVLLHIPQDLISKNKFCLNEPLDGLSPKIQESMLYLDTFVLTSDFSKSCNICSRCIKREQKRASRRKSGHESEAIECSSPNTPHGVVKNNPNSWADDKMMKKAIIFNCKEIVSFPRPTGLDTDERKTMDLSARIICYCRHHKESEGFRLLFVVKNHHGEVVGKLMSTPIMIMDRKKNIASKEEGSSVKQEELATLHPLSPNSIDESASEILTNTDTDRRGLKRKKLSVDDLFNAATNPMFNGSFTGFSPTSNSDTNTSVNNLTKPGPQFGLPMVPSQPAQTLPSIQRIIPAQGPIRGGIEVTLLGFNFRPGLAVKFGANPALATHCWSETTIVTYLPPATQPGQVLVCFENHENMMLGGVQQQQIFTYTDDTDRQLIELALQIVGLKMNGKLEDAKNIAKRIVGSDLATNSPGGGAAPLPASTTQAREWYDNAHRAVEQLTNSDLSTEDILINFLLLVDLPNCPTIPNWLLCNKQGQSVMHLATLKNYTQLIRFLITHGCKIDIQDNQGITPLFLASMGGYRDLINTFLDCKCDWNLKLLNDRHLKDYCDLNVLDIFNNLSEDLSDDFTSHMMKNDVVIDKLTKSMSLDLLNSMFAMNYGRHISKMVSEDTGGRVRRGQAPPLAAEHDSDMADSEHDSDDYHYDLEDDYSSVETDTSLVHEPEPAVRPRSEHTTGLWQRVKNVFNSDLENELPSYDDLFPFGPGFSRPKAAPVQSPVEGPSSALKTEEEVQSDSSEDLVVSYINRPRKNFENDKMLFFFWLPVLVLILGFFLYVSITGYEVETFEHVRLLTRNTLGNLMVGNERIGRVFNHA